MATAAATLAAALSMAQPCAAQVANGVHLDRPPSAFAGLSLRLALDAGATPVPQIRLQFTADAGSRDGSNREPNERPRGLEIGLLGSGKPTVFVNGRSALAVRDQMNLGGSGRTFLIVGGVLVAVAVIALAAGGAGLGDTCPTIDGSRDHCINP